MKLKDIIDQKLTKPIEYLKEDPELCLEVQQRFVFNGLLPKADGKYGAATEAAFAKFKEARYLAQPGSLGPSTAEALLKANYPNTLAGKVVKVCDARGYVLDRREGFVNIIGLEGVNPDGTFNDDTPNKWNDSVGLLTFKSGVPTFLCLCQGTTEPGSTYTFRPTNPNGVARLDVGQHKDLWMVGLHKGYEAMQQVGTARIVRDKNKNFSRDDKVTYEVNNGINLHSCRAGFWASLVDNWSSGCSVIRDWNQFLNFMKLVKQSAQYKANRGARFTYTLLWRDWLK